MDEKVTKEDLLIFKKLINIELTSMIEEFTGLKYEIAPQAVIDIIRTRLNELFDRIENTL